MQPPYETYKQETENGPHSFAAWISSRRCRADCHRLPRSHAEMAALYAIMFICTDLSSSTSNRVQAE